MESRNLSLTLDQQRFRQAVLESIQLLRDLRDQSKNLEQNRCLNRILLRLSYHALHNGPASIPYCELSLLGVHREAADQLHLSALQLRPSPD